MNVYRKRLLVVAVVGSVFFISVGSAQDGVELNERNRNLLEQTRRNDLDAYWLDQNTWQFYGYRPHTKLYGQHRTAIPEHYDGHRHYIYGTTIENPAALKLGEPVTKSKIQMAKYGTWH